MQLTGFSKAKVRKLATEAAETAPPLVLADIQRAPISASGLNARARIRSREMVDAAMLSDAETVARLLSEAATDELLVAAANVRTTAEYRDYGDKFCAAIKSEKNRLTAQWQQLREDNRDVIAADEARQRELLARGISFDAWPHPVPEFADLQKRLTYLAGLASSAGELQGEAIGAAKSAAAHLEAVASATRLSSAGYGTATGDYRKWQTFADEARRNGIEVSVPQTL